jgi:hypothetical protein
VSTIAALRQLEPRRWTGHNPSAACIHERASCVD